EHVDVRRDISRFDFRRENLRGRGSRDCPQQASQARATEAARAAPSGHDFLRVLADYWRFPASGPGRVHLTVNPRLHANKSYRQTLNCWVEQRHDKKNLPSGRLVLVVAIDIGGTFT